MNMDALWRSTVTNTRCFVSRAKTPRRPDNLHRPLDTKPDRLADVLCRRDERYVDNQLEFSYDRQRIILAEKEITRGLPAKYVDSYEYPDGRLGFRWKGVSLPYSFFYKAPPKKRRTGKQR